jgi:hypothetical protein
MRLPERQVLRTYYERALAISEARLGPDDRDTVHTLNNLGAVLGGPPCPCLRLGSAPGTRWPQRFPGILLPFTQRSAKSPAPQAMTAHLPPPRLATAATIGAWAWPSGRVGWQPSESAGCVRARHRLGPLSQVVGDGSARGPSLPGWERQGGVIIDF